MLADIKGAHLNFLVGPNSLSHGFALRALRIAHFFAKCQTVNSSGTQESGAMMNIASLNFQKGGNWEEVLFDNSITSRFI